MKKLLSFVAVLVWFAPAARAQDLNEKLEEAMKAAVRKVAPSVVQIITEGGTDMVVTTPKGPVFRKALGPTTGVIVSADGYIISSAFNFLNSPTGILVSVPGHADPYVAKKIATDRNRMLTLIKIEKAGLPVPAAVPVKEMREGQWAIALGRVLDSRRDAPPSVSVGIISALGRIWGKAVQLDAKVSPVNYGGPIVDIQGRVQGIIIPASPQVKEDGSMEETAGFEWYESGIGFAIPFDDILNLALPRLKQGKDLKPVLLTGLVGPVTKNDDMLEATPAVRQVPKDSAAARAGLQVGDIIIEVDGQPTPRMSQFRHIIGRKYDGDKVTLKFKRGAEVKEVKDLELSSTVQTVAHPFLGILPMRDDPRLGLEVRFVYPKSPADKAGLKEGDRIVKYAAGAKELQPFTGPKFPREQFTEFLNTLTPGNDISLEIVRKNGKTTDKVAVKLESLTQELAIPDKLEKGSLEKAREPLQTGKEGKVEPDNRKVDKGLISRVAPGGQQFYVFVPETYDANVSHALIVYLHLPGQKEEKDFDQFSDKWADLCERKNMIMLFPVTNSESGWVPGEAGFVAETVRDTLGRYTIDKQRIVAHGMAVGGQMALHLGFNNRDLFRGVSVTGAVANHPRDNVKDQRLAFYIAGGELDPLIDHIAKSAAKLLDMNYPVTLRKIAARGREYLEGPQMREMANWIDSLDKQ